MMRCLSSIATAIFLCLVVASPACSADSFVDLFDGESLGGWKVIGAPASAWTANDGVLICAGESAPRHYLRTHDMYENFVLELEWKLTSAGGNSGVFIYADALPQVGAPFPRSVEAQIHDGDHGSIFGIRGSSIEPLSAAGHKGKTVVARPAEERCHPIGQWNRYRLTSKAGVVELAVNGKAVTRARSHQRHKGYIALQAEHKRVHFRNIRIQPLPTDNPAPNRIARADEGHWALFDGASFQGWKHLHGHRGHWTVEDGIIKYDGKATEAKRADKDLWTTESFGDFHLLADWRLPAKPTMKEHPFVQPNGDFVYLEGRKRKTFPSLDAGDSGVYLRGSSKAQLNIWSQNLGSGEINGYRTDRNLPPEIRQACIPSKKADHPFGEWNRFDISMQGDRVTVVLNGTCVIDRARLPGVPKAGPIALQHHGDPIEFRNILIRRLE